MNIYREQMTNHDVSSCRMRIWPW